MPRYPYPHVIENGAGERLTFVRRVPGSRAERVEGETLVLPGAGPPMHVHHLQEEGFTVLEGRIGYQLAGGQPQFAGPGESLVFEAGVPHRFWNAGEGPLRCFAYVEPADNVEFFLTTLFESTRENGGKRPGIFDAAYLLTRYRTEFGMLEIPPFAQRFVLPLVVAAGTLLGKYRKFRDAPQPVRRG